MRKKQFVTGLVVTVIGCAGWLLSNISSSSGQTVQRHHEQFLANTSTSNAPKAAAASSTSSKPLGSKLDPQMATDFKQYANVVSSMSWDKSPSEIYKTLNPITKKVEGELFSNPVIGDDARSNLYMEVGKVDSELDGLRFDIDHGTSTSIIVEQVINPMKTSAIQSAADVKDYLGRN